MISSRLRLLALLAIGAGIVALFPSGCTAESSVTQTCRTNTTQKGSKPESKGCDEFPVCAIHGKRADPCECCKKKTGSDLTNCLYGFGAEGKVCPGETTSTTTTTTTTTGGGMGGVAGGGVGGGGGSGGGGGAAGGS